MLNVGIIGLGVGEAHIAGYRKHPGCRVTALCDIAEEKEALAKSSYSDLRFTRNASDILTDPSIHVVSIASYDDVHAEQVLLALRHGKHVFAEKPLCLFPEEARRIRAALAKDSKLQLSSNLILRRSPRFMRIKEEIECGTFGTLYSVEGDYNYGRIQKVTQGWRGKIDYYSVVYGGAIHLVDLLLWFTGKRVTEVSAFGTNIATKGTQFRFHDTVTALLRFEDGMVGKIGVNYGCVLPHGHLLALYGTAGTFFNRADGSAALYRSREKDTLPEAITDPYPGVEKGALIASFVDSIVKGSRAYVTSDDTFASLSVCFAIERAVTSGETEKVESL